MGHCNGRIKFELNDKLMHTKNDSRAKMVYQSIYIYDIIAENIAFENVIVFNIF